jgi:hypothetical protein
MPVEAEIFLRERIADQDRGVDLRGQCRRLEDPGDIEPHAAGPDPLAGEDPVDPDELGGGGAEDGDRLVLGGGVEELALGG